MSQRRRVFSQQAELSQLDSLSYAHSDTNNGKLQESQEMFDHSQEYQHEVTENQLSSRADAICEENRQISNFVQSSLKQLEKRRINLINKKKTIEDEEKDILEVHERQHRESLAAQMELEEWSEKYQNELSHRPKLLEKQKHTQHLVDVFEKYYGDGVACIEDIQKAQQNLHSVMESKYKELETMKLKRHQLKLLFKNEIEQKIAKAQEYKKAIAKEREEHITEIQKLAHQNVEKSNKINLSEDELNHGLNKTEELRNELNAISLQNKTLSEGITELHRSLDECRACGGSRIQDLKLQINTEQNDNSHLEEKCKEKEDYSNNLSTKQKELVNLSNQIKIAVENALKENDEQLTKFKECEFKKRSLSEQADYFAEGIKKHLNAEEENNRLKKTQFTLEEDIKSCTTAYEEKEDLVKNLNDQAKDSNSILIELEDKKIKLDSELEKYQSVKNELISKEQDSYMIYQQEREEKILLCNNMEQENIKLSHKENEIRSTIEELKVLNKSLETEGIEIDILLQKYNRDSEENKEKLYITEEENEKLLKSLKENIDEKYNELEIYEESLCELKPKQDKLMLIKTKKHTLEQDLLDKNENFKRENELLGGNFNSKELELNREIENYTMVMKKILKGEEVATENLTVEIQGTEKNKLKVENELKLLNKQLITLKNEEVNKRERMVRMENRLRKINNEIKVTKQDLTDAITGKVQAPRGIPTLNKQVTPTSSLYSFKNQNEPLGKKMAYSRGLEHIPNVPNQVTTEKWVEAVPDDEYDFTEI
uniref:Uncharacterized protein n=1 Tax=Graphocephala atropunctata TaxID=36148 RepID=A0A1B6KZ69_9HEMI